MLEWAEPCRVPSLTEWAWRVATYPNEGNCMMNRNFLNRDIYNSIKSVLAQVHPINRFINAHNLTSRGRRVKFNQKRSRNPIAKSLVGDCGR